MSSIFIFFFTTTLKVYRKGVMKNEAKKFSIDEICTLVEMNKRTVRYYIQKGLVDRPEGTGKGAFYSHNHLDQLLAIRKWKAAGLSLERIQDILSCERADDTDDQLLPPPISKKQGMVEVWSRMYVSDGVELHIEPGRAGLNPDQVRRLFKGIMDLVQKIRKDDL